MSSAQTVERVTRVRWYQRDLHEYLLNTPGGRAIEIAHRRWGKDEIALDAAFKCANLVGSIPNARVGTYWHCLPEYAQARKAMWTAVNAHTGKRRIDEMFPMETRESTNEQEMFIRFKSGSTWQLIGSDRYDSTVGAGPVWITYSEWALANPSAWAYHRPMLEENNGTACFITTPRGRNHAKTMLEMAKKSPRWFAEVSSIKDTKALSAEQLEESLAEYIALYGEDLGEAQFEQEYHCSFNAAILGAFYAREMLAVRNEGRIKPLVPFPGEPVHTAWDIGTRDDTSIWWFQVRGGKVYVLDCYTASGVGVDHYAQVCHDKGWKRGVDYVPHDAKVTEWGTGRTRVESMIKERLNPRLVPMASKLDGINAVRKTLPLCLFSPECEEKGISALEQYRREWDDEKKTFRQSEVRDWTTHLSDAFRYLSLAWRAAPSVVANEPKAPPSGTVYLPGIPQPSNSTRIKV
jgi:phage terminase large subunit